MISFNVSNTITIALVALAAIAISNALKNAIASRMTPVAQ